MEYRLPYYMAYPMPLQYDDEKTERRDLEYMKSMYPISVKRILPIVEEECERMSYHGSMIYDEYPDQLQIRMMCNRICDRWKKEAQSKGDKEDVQAPYEMIQILLFQELRERRRKYRLTRRRFY